MHFSQNIEPSSIAKASDAILVCAGDVKETIYMVTLELNGVTVEGKSILSPSETFSGAKNSVGGSYRALKKRGYLLKDIFDKPCKPMGAKGTILSQTQSSVCLICKGLQDLKELLQELNTSYKVDLHGCLTVQVETFMRSVILRTNSRQPYSMLAIWGTQSMKASN